MKCKDIKLLIQAFIDNEITEKEKKTLTDHLKRCGNCQRILEEANKGSEILKQIPSVELPPYFEAKVWARIRRETVKSPRFRLGLVPKLAFATVAIVTGIILFHPRTPTPDIYIVCPEMNSIVSSRDAVISAAFYNKPRDGMVSLILNGKEITPIAEIRKDHLIYSPEEALKEGYYEVSVQVKDRKGTTKIVKNWLFYVVENGEKDIDI